MIKVIVLSLKNSERREIIIRRLKNVGIEQFEFFDAFDARSMTLVDLNKHFDIKRFSDIYKREPARGEIGCTLSHISIWNKIAKSECDKWIILEDDAILMPWFNVIFRANNFPSGLSLLGYSKISMAYGIIANVKHFFKSSTNRKKRKYLYSFGEKNGDKSGLKWCLGTVGYTIEKSTAKILLEKHGIFPYFMTDDFLLHSKYISVNHIRPFMVYEDFKCLKSSIETERSEKMEKGMRTQ